MPKFTFKISYSQEGLKGTLAEGFAKREYVSQESSAHFAFP